MAWRKWTFLKITPPGERSNNDKVTHGHFQPIPFESSIAFKNPLIADLSTKMRQNDEDLILRNFAALSCLTFGCNVQRSPALFFFEAAGLSRLRSTFSNTCFWFPRFTYEQNRLWKSSAQSSVDRTKHISLLTLAYLIRSLPSNVLVELQ